MGILFRKKKDKQPPKDAPKWFVLLMGGFLLYAILDSLLTDRVDQVRESNKKAAEKQVSTFMFNPLLPLKQGGRGMSVFARDLVAGTGKEAQCRETVTLRYSLHRRDGSVVEDHLPETTEAQRFTIGRGEVIPALERGLIGMKEGGRRQITARADQAYGAEGFTHPVLTASDEIALDIRLLSVESPRNLPVNDLGVRIYTDGSGKGRIFQCLDTVEFRLKGWRADGTPLWSREESAQTHKVRIGEGKAPYAIERALTGTQGYGRRTLIVSPGYMRSIRDYEEWDVTAQQAEEKSVLFSEPLVWEDLSIPQDEVILLEIEVLPEEKPVPVSHNLFNSQTETQE